MLYREKEYIILLMTDKYYQDKSSKIVSVIQPLAVIIFFLFANSQAQSQDTIQYFPQMQYNGGGAIYRLFSESSDSKRVELDGSNYDMEYVCKYSWYDAKVKFGKKDIHFNNVNKKNGLAFLMNSTYYHAGLELHARKGIMHFGISADLIKFDSLHFFDYSSSIGLCLEEFELPTYEVKIVSRHLPIVCEAKYDSIDAILITPINLIHIKQRVRYSIYNIQSSIAYMNAYPQSDHNIFTYSQKNDSRVDGWAANMDYTKPDYKLSVNYRNLDLRSSIILQSNGLEYGNISVTGIHYYSFNAVYKKYFSNHCTLSVTGDYLTISGKLAGHIESWPFATVIQSLFVNRGYVRLSGSATVEATSVTGSIPVDHFDIVPALTFCRIIPNLVFETWKPAFLVFGVSDYSRSEANFKEMGAGIIKMQMIYNTNRFIFQLEGNQLFPVYSIGKTKNSGNLSSSEPGTTSTARHIVDGGRWFKFNIGIKF